MSVSVNSSLFSPLECDAPLPPDLPFPSETWADIEIENEDLVLTQNSDPVTVLVKRGYRETTSDLTCGVLFDKDPIWLWSLRPNSWSKIYLTVSDETRLRLEHN